jgi:hypothetical protein
LVLSTTEQQRRRAFISVFEDISSACDLIIGIVKPPGGTPIGPYYEQIASQFTAAVEENFPEVLKRLTSEGASMKVELEKMRGELQSRTELAIRAARGFVG